MKKIVLILSLILITLPSFAESPYISETISAHSLFDVNDKRYVNKSGDTMSGDLTVNADITATDGISGNTVTATTAIYIDSTRYDKNFNTQVGFWNGSFLEFFNALVTSDGATVTMKLDNATLYEPELTMNFSDGYSKIASGSTVALTAGSDIAPQANYIYIPQSTKVLTKSTTAFPTTAEHIKVGYFLVGSAGYVQTDGAYINQNWNDGASGTDFQGHMLHIGERSRRFGARYFSGVGPNGTDDVAASSYFDYVSGTEAYFKSAAGVVYQMHSHTYPAKDTRTDDIHVVNERAAGAGGNGAYWAIHDITDIDEDTGGGALNNRYFNLTFFGVANKTGEYGPIMVNLPTGSYANQTSAVNDVSGYDVFSMPREFNLESSTGFLIARITFKNTAGNWTHISTVDLRGSTPTTATGGVAGVATNFADNQFTIFDETDTTKIAAFDVGTLISTATTRTFKLPDTDATIFVDDGTVPMTGNLDMDFYDLVDVGAVTSNSVTGTVVTGTTVFAPQLWIGGGTNRYLMPTTYPTDNYIPKYDDALKQVVWEADTGTATPAGANTQIQFNDSGAFGADADFVYVTGTDRLFFKSAFVATDVSMENHAFIGSDVDSTLRLTFNETVGAVSGHSVIIYGDGRTYVDGLLGCSSTITGNTVSATTVIGTTVTGNTITGNTIYAWEFMTGDNHHTFPRNDTIQFTVEQPDQIDTSDLLTVWSNESNLTFNITEVKGWSDTIYNAVIGMATAMGADNGTVADYSIGTSGTDLYYGSNASVSWSTITNSTVLYFDASADAPNHVKITIKGFYN